jgi:hypothetical protein
MELESVQPPAKDDNAFSFGDENLNQDNNTDMGALDGGDTGTESSSDSSGDQSAPDLGSLFAGEMKSGKLMSEDDFAEIDKLLDDDIDLDKAKNSKGANVSNKSNNSRGKYKSHKQGFGNVIPTDKSGGADSRSILKTLNNSYKDFNLADGILPQSPINEKFVDKQITARMSKDLDSMSKTLGIKGNKSKSGLIKEENDILNDILIDDELLNNDEDK